MTQSEQSKKRMKQLCDARVGLKYDPISLDEIAEGEFNAGYLAGMSDPEANAELLEEVEAYLARVSRDHEVLIQPERHVTEAAALLKKLREVRG